MFRRTTFTTITPLPPNISREVVITFLQDHLEMIDLNPLVKERHPIPPPPHAEPDEQTCVWYSLTDKISYLPGDLYTGDVTYTCAFHNIPTGVKTHCYAPAGLNIRDSWTVEGSEPADPSVGPGPGAATEAGLYIREAVDMRCNILLTAFVRRTLKKSHAALVERLKVRAQTSSKVVPDTATTGMGDGGLTVPGGSSVSVASSGKSEAHMGGEAGSTTASSGPRLRTPSPNPGGVSAETMQYYRHWEAPSSPPPPPPPPKDSPRPSKDTQVSDRQRRPSSPQTSPDPTPQQPPPTPPKDPRITDSLSPTPQPLPAESQQHLDTSQLLPPQRQDTAQHSASGPGRSPSTAALVPAPLRIRSRSPPQQRLENPPIGSPPLSTADTNAAAAPEKADGQAIPEVKVPEDSPIGARLKGPFVDQLP